MYRGLSDIKDREICCYSISCKERENIGRLSENEGLLIMCFLDITLQWLIQQAKNQKS